LEPHAIGKEARPPCVHNKISRNDVALQVCISRVVMRIHNWTATLIAVVFYWSIRSQALGQRQVIQLSELSEVNQLKFVANHRRGYAISSYKLAVLPVINLY
jgi:hypothetical protein